VVARDGLEPPTPAFSGLSDQSLTDQHPWKHKTYAKTIWAPERFGLHADSNTRPDLPHLWNCRCSYARGRNRLLNVAHERRDNIYISIYAVTTPTECPPPQASEALVKWITWSIMWTHQWFQIYL